MKVIGLVGGVGTGKTEVLYYLSQNYGVYPCSTDEIGRSLQRKGEVGYQKMVETFGEGILDSKGEIDREKVAKLIFSEEEKRKKLNHLIHPLVKEEVKERIEREKTKGRRFFFIESALLFEDDYPELCDEIWFIHTTEAIRKQRLALHRGYSEEKTDGICSAQLSEEAFLRKSHRVIKNEGSFEQTKKILDDLMKIIGEENLDEIM